MQHGYPAEAFFSFLEMFLCLFPLLMEKTNMTTNFWVDQAGLHFWHPINEGKFLNDFLNCQRKNEWHCWKRSRFWQLTSTVRFSASAKNYKFIGQSILCNIVYITFLFIWFSSNITLYPSIPHLWLVLDWSSNNQWNK